MLTENELERLLDQVQRLKQEKAKLEGEVETALWFGGLGLIILGPSLAAGFAYIARDWGLNGQVYGSVIGALAIGPVTTFLVIAKIRDLQRKRPWRRWWLYRAYHALKNLNTERR